MTATTSWNAARQTFATLWAQRSGRERQMLKLAAGVLGAALVWNVGLAPALRTWQEAPQRQAALDAQTQNMLQLQAQARRLQMPSKIQRQDAIQRIESATQEWLGADARVSLQGDQVQVSLRNSSAQGLARWLAQVRSQAQAIPTQAQLQRTPDGAAEARWSGTMVLRMN